MNKVKILGLDGNPVKNPIKKSFKARKEARRYQKVLKEIVNEYINFAKLCGDPLRVKAKYVELQNKWTGYAISWNADRSNVSTLRITDFTNIIEKFKDSNFK